MKRICPNCLKKDERSKPPYDMNICERCGDYKFCADVDYFPREIESLFGKLRENKEEFNKHFNPDEKL